MSNFYIKYCNTNNVIYKIYNYIYFINFVFIYVNNYINYLLLFSKKSTICYVLIYNFIFKRSRSERFSCANSVKSFNISSYNF